MCFYDIHVQAISLWSPRSLFYIISLKILLLELLTHLPGANELNCRNSYRNDTHFPPYYDSSMWGPIRWYKWLYPTLWYLHCISNADTTVLCKAMDRVLRGQTWRKYTEVKHGGCTWVRGSYGRTTNEFPCLSINNDWIFTRQVKSMVKGTH